MAKLDILRYPDKRLRQVAKPVTDFNDSVRTLSENMAETMYGAPGIGLAAVQVTVALRVVVMDLSEEKNDLKVLILSNRKAQFAQRKDVYQCRKFMLRLSAQKK